MSTRKKVQHIFSRSQNKIYWDSIGNKKRYESTCMTLGRMGISPQEAKKATEIVNNYYLNSTPGIPNALKYTPEGYFHAWKISKKLGVKNEEQIISRLKNTLEVVLALGGRKFLALFKNISKKGG